MRSSGRQTGIGRRVAILGMCSAFALILSYVESLFPFCFGIPGMKLGLPNLAVVLLLFLGDPVGALAVNLLRILLSGFLFGSLYGILFSIAGAAVSFAVMIAFRRTGRFGITGVSIAGGVAHDLGQLAIAAWVVRTSGILYYTPALIAAGAVTGFLIGITAGAVLPAVRQVYSTGGARDDEGNT